MLREVLYGKTNMPLIKNSLDAYALRQRALASNIANSETAGYEARKVTFEERLARALGDPVQKLVATDPDHMPLRPDPKKVEAMVVVDHSGETTTGINGVDIDQQMTHMASNSMHYAMATRRAAALFADFRTLTRLP